jgi:hypothetical protein
VSVSHRDQTTVRIRRELAYADIGFTALTARSSIYVRSYATDCEAKDEGKHERIPGGASSAVAGVMFSSCVQMNIPITEAVAHSMPSVKRRTRSVYQM